MAAPRSSKGEDSSTLDTTRQMLDELDALMERMLALPAEDSAEPTPQRPTIKADVTLFPEPAKPTAYPPRSRLRDLRKTLTDPEPTPHVESMRVTVPTPKPMADEETEPTEEGQVSPTREQRLSKFLEPGSPALPSRSVPAPRPNSQPELPPASARPKSGPALPIAVPRPKTTPPVPVAMPVRVEKDAIEPMSLEVIPPSTAPSVLDLPEPRPNTTSLMLLPLLAINQVFDLFTYLLGPMGKVFRSPAGRMILGYTGLAMLILAGLWYLRDAQGWTWDSLRPIIGD